MEAIDFSSLGLLGDLVGAMDEFGEKRESGCFCANRWLQFGVAACWHVVAHPSLAITQEGVCCGTAVGVFIVCGRRR